LPLSNISIKFAIFNYGKTNYTVQSILDEKVKTISFVPLSLVLTITTIFILSNLTSTNADSNETHSLHVCSIIGQLLRCDPVKYKFDSVSVIGHTQLLYTVNQTRFEPVEGVFGNALSPSIFSVSFWMRQDPAFLGTSSILSHINYAKNAGWYFSLNASKSGPFVQFSVANTDGKVFTASAPLDPDIFENVVGTFDGKLISVYVEGLLINSTKFSGDYNPDSNTPLNIGLNAYDFRRPWNGVIDELRIYNRTISDGEIQANSDYRQYSKLKSASIFASSDGKDGLISYWPFDNGTRDKSKNGNDGNLILQTVSMAFSPDGKLFYSVRDAGEIRIINEFGRQLKTPFVRLLDVNANSRTHQDIFGISVDPNFATNHYVYAYRTSKDNKTGEVYNQVIRFTESGNKGTDKKILLDKIPVGQKQGYAGALTFGPDDKLYITTDYTNQIEANQNTSLAGKVLRINRNGSAPLDNPFPNSSVYTLGQGNIFGIAFDKMSGKALVAENDAKNGDKLYILKDGGNYGVPDQQQLSSVILKASQSNSSLGIEPFRIYHKTITPTQAIFYDGNKFPSLKGKFLIVAQGEGSIYALTLNNTGSFKELAIRLPDVQGHITSIAKAPNGDIYLGGERIYKLTSIDSNTISPLTYFIDFASNTSSLKIKYFYLNFDTKVMSINITSSKSQSANNGSSSLPSLKVTIPKVLLGGIFDVTSEKYNNTKKAADRIVQDFNVKETRRVANVGDSIVDISLGKDIVDDGLLITGRSSALFQSSSRNVIVVR
jgi:glucose/arabinose dehydrogenase